MNERKKPAIRFKGFSDEWEQHPINELTTELHEYTTLDSSYPLLTSSREGIMFQNQYRSNRTTENSKTLFSIVPYGKCTYRHMSDDDIFHFNINDIVENGLVSREYPVFDSTDDNDLHFIVALLNSSEQFRKFCRERKIGGTRTRLYYKDLSNFKPLCPEFDEQRNIAEFLNGITSIISQHQSKLEKLQALKASMLEKMFPRDGTDVPEVRFKKFAGAWKQRKLGDIIVEYNEQSEKNGTYEHVSLTKEGVVPKSAKYDRDSLVQHEDKKYRITHIDDICYNPANLKFGVICRNTYNTGIFSPIYVTFKVRPENNPKFVEHYVRREKFIAKALLSQEGTVYERMSVKPADLIQIDVLCPNVEEQECIGDFFSTIDNLITLHQYELDKLLSIKKALLEKMFV